MQDIQITGSQLCSRVLFCFQTQKSVYVNCEHSEIVSDQSAEG